MAGATVFVEVISTDDDDVNSDEEVQYVPYVKPPPPVIDLLLTSDEDEPCGDGEKPESKKSSRKRKRSKTYETDDEKSVSAGLPNSDQSPHNETPFCETPSAENVGQNERMLIHAVTTTKKVNDADGELGTSVNAGPIVSMNNLSSSNVGTSSLSNNDESNHQSHFICENASLPGARIASSIFEPDNEVLGEPFSSAVNGAASSVEQLNENVAVSGTIAIVTELGGDASSSEMGLRIPGQSQQGGQLVLPVVGSRQVRKAAPPKRKRNSPLPVTEADGAISTAATPPPRKRVSKQQRASQRTNEEINNFLTTLGIFEPNETIPDTSTRRRPRQRGALTITPLPLDVESLSLVPPPPASEPDVDPVIVPLTSSIPTMSESVAPLSKASSKRAKANPGSESSKQSNQLKQTLSVAAGGVPSLLPPIVIDGGLTPADILSIGRTRFVSPNEDVGILTRSEMAALSFNISSVLDAPPTPKIRATTKDPIPKKIPAVPTTGTESDLQTSSENCVTDINRHTPGLTIQAKSTEVEVRQRDPDPYTFIDTDVDNENEVTSRPSYIPSKWSSGMVKYYDCTSNEDMRLSRVLSQMSDNPSLWETNEAQFYSSQKANRRLRCVNCNQFGHVIWSCKEKRKKPVCHYCGEEGHGGSGRDYRDRGHNRNRCPNAVCLNCGRKQPTTTHGCRRCMFTNKPPRCETCDIEGHLTSSCPDNWRRYFSTTTTVVKDGSLQLYGDKPVYRLHKDSFCATCGQKGHNFFHCRFRGRTSSGDNYIKQNVRIVHELPQPPLRKRTTPTATVVSSKSTEEVPQSLILCGSNNDEQLTATARTDTVSINDDDEIEVLPTGNVNKCMDPECQNTPKPNTYCFEMLIKQKDHKLMQTAREENKISESMKPNAQLSILQSRNAIHIYSDDIPQCQADILKLILKLNTEAFNKNSKPKLPEVITIDEDDDIVVEKKTEPLTVALLESEWDLIFSESLKVDGLIAQLTEKFNVNIFVSKPNLTATIENGTEENKKLAQKNVVFWLECQAAHVDYVMQLRIEDMANNTPVTPWNKKKKKKRNQPPHPKKFKNRKRLENNSAMISDLIPNASLNHNISQQSGRLRKQKNRRKFKDRNRRESRPDEIPMMVNNNNVGSPSTSNNGNMRYFNNGQQTPFQHGDDGRFPNPNYNNNYNGPPPPSFHPSFINHQQHPQQRPPPLLGDFVAFRYDSSRNRRGGAGGGRGNGRGSGSGGRNRGNYKNRQSPNKRQQV